MPRLPPHDFSFPVFVIHYSPARSEALGSPSLPYPLFLFRSHEGDDSSSRERKLSRSVGFLRFSFFSAAHPKYLVSSPLRRGLSFFPLPFPFSPLAVEKVATHQRQFPDASRSGYSFFPFKIEDYDSLSPPPIFMGDPDDRSFRDAATPISLPFHRPLFFPRCRAKSPRPLDPARRFCSTAES